MNKPLQTLAKLAEAVGVDYSAINSDDMIIQTAEAALKRIEELRRAVLEEIEHRDDHAESADILAGEIARFFEVDIGEHSSANFPWDNAFEAIPDSTLAALKAEWQKADNYEQEKTCTYPKCNCPFDAPDDNFLCARGLKREPRQ